MDTVHRKQRCYCHGSPLRQLVWIAGTCLVEFPTKSRGYGVWVVGVTKYAVFRFPPIQGYPTVGVAKYAVCRIKCFAPRRGYLTVGVTKYAVFRNTCFLPEGAIRRWALQNTPFFVTSVSSDRIPLSSSCYGIRGLS